MNDVDKLCVWRIQSDVRWHTLEINAIKCKNESSKDQTLLLRGKNLFVIEIISKVLINLIYDCIQWETKLWNIFFWELWQLISNQFDFWFIFFFWHVFYTSDFIHLGNDVFDDFFNEIRGCMIAHLKGCAMIYSVIWTLT